jgi:hypothetical protein
MLAPNVSELRIVYLRFVEIVAAEYIIPCTKGDPEVNGCIRNTFNHLRKYLNKGNTSSNIQQKLQFVSD